MRRPARLLLALIIPLTLGFAVWMSLRFPAWQPNEDWRVLELVRDRFRERGLELPLDSVQLKRIQESEVAAHWPSPTKEWISVKVLGESLGDSCDHASSDEDDSECPYAGFYLRETQTIVLVDRPPGATSGDRLDPSIKDMLGRSELRYVIAHEAAHAWQHQNGRMANPSTIEQAWVLRCRLEGEAEFLASLILAEDSEESWASSWEESSANLAFSDGPMLAPYHLGYAHAQHMFHELGWPAVLESSWPVSTEQLLHPSKWKQDNPTPVSLPKWPGSLGPIDEEAEDVLGEFFLHSVLPSKGQFEETWVLAATGWDGERLRVARTPYGSALMWRTVWDRDEDARQFQAAMKFSFLGLIRREGQVVDLAWAFSPSIQRELMASMAVHPVDALPDPFDGATTEAIEEAWRRQRLSIPMPKDESHWHFPGLGFSVAVRDGWHLADVTGDNPHLRWQQGRAVLEFAALVDPEGSESWDLDWSDPEQAAGDLQQALAKTDEELPELIRQRMPIRSDCQGIRIAGRPAVLLTVVGGKHSTSSRSLILPEEDGILMIRVQAVGTDWQLVEGEAQAILDRVKFDPAR